MYSSLRKEMMTYIHIYIYTSIYIYMYSSLRKEMMTYSCNLIYVKHTVFI